MQTTIINALSLQAINAQYAAELKQVAAEVIDSGWYLQGNRLATFEQQLATYLNLPHAIGVASGLDALRTIWHSYIELGVMCEGDEVIVPANTFIATLLAITQSGLVPIFVEPSPLTHNIDIAQIEAHLTPRTRAICIVHLYGRCCWSSELAQLAATHQLKVVEDNAQALGARWAEKNTMCGALGDAAGISFYPGKNLGALGDAGAIVTHDPALAQAARAISNYGSQVKYHNQYVGYNSRMDELQAAFLSVKLKHLDQQNDLRKRIAHYYDTHITHPAISLPTAGAEGEHLYHQYVITTPHREALQHYLKQTGIETLIHYPIPPHKQPCYPQYNALHLPIAEQLAQEVLSLPISPLLTSSEQERVVDSLNSWSIQA